MQQQATRHLQSKPSKRVKRVCLQFVGKAVLTCQVVILSSKCLLSKPGDELKERGGKGKGEAEGRDTWTCSQQPLFNIQSYKTIEAEGAVNKVSALTYPKFSMAPTPVCFAKRGPLQCGQHALQASVACFLARAFSPLHHT